MPTTLPYRYPLDPTGVNPNNLVANEQHTLPNRTIRIVAPTYGAFYTAGLIIRDLANGIPLTTSQFKTAELYEFPTARYGKEICGIILITDASVSNSISIDYHALGGEYSTNTDAIVAMLNTINLDNRPTAWGDIINKPAGFVPAMHYHDVGDVYGFEYVVDALERIRQGLIEGDAVSHDLIYKYIDNWAATIQGNSGSNLTQLTTHINNLNNPHIVTASQVGLGSVQNFSVADLSTAQAGVSNATYMTPFLTAQAIVQQAIPVINSHVNRNDNPHSTTKAQVGLGNVQNLSISDLATAQAGTRNDFYMTPFLTAQAFISQLPALISSSVPALIATQAINRTVQVWQKDSENTDRIFFSTGGGPVYVRGGTGSADILRLRSSINEGDQFKFTSNGIAYFSNGLNIGQTTPYADLTVAGTNNSIAVGVASGNKGGYLNLVSSAAAGYIASNNYINGGDRASIAGFSTVVAMYTSTNEIKFLRSTASVAIDAPLTYVQSGKFDPTGNFFVGPQNSTSGYTGLIASGSATNTGHLGFYQASGSRSGYIGNATSSTLEIGTDTSAAWRFVGGKAPQSDTAASSALDLVRYQEMNSSLNNKFNAAVNTWNLDVNGNSRMYFDTSTGVTYVAGYGTNIMIVRNTTTSENTVVVHGNNSVDFLNTITVAPTTGGRITVSPGNGTNTGYVGFYNAAGSYLGYIGYADSSSIKIASYLNLPYKFIGGAAPQSDTAASNALDLVRYQEMNVGLNTKVSAAVNTWCNDVNGNQRFYFDTTTGMTYVGGSGSILFIVRNTPNGQNVVTVNGNGTTDFLSTISVTSNGSGKISLLPGNGTNTGYVGFYQANGTRVGYIGYADSSSINIASDTGLPYMFTDAPPKSNLAAVTSNDLLRYGEFLVHSTSTSNPHSVTASQVGLGNVQNYSISDLATAQAGTRNDFYMTPFLTASAINSQVKTSFNAHASDLNNPHSVTAAQVGLGNVQNFAVATQAEAQAGAASSQYMTPLRTAQAIAVLATTPTNAALANRLTSFVGTWNTDNVGSNRIYFGPISGNNGSTTIAGYGSTTLYVQNASLGTIVLGITGSGIATLRNTLLVTDGTANKINLNPGSSNTGYVEFCNTSGSRLGYIGNSTSSYHSIGTDSTSIPYKFVGGAAPQSDTAATQSADLVRFNEAITNKVNVWQSDSDGSARFYFSSNSTTYIRGNGTGDIVRFRRGTDETDMYNFAANGVAYFVGGLGIGTSKTPYADLTINGSNSIAVGVAFGANGGYLNVSANANVGYLYSNQYYSGGYKSSNAGYSTGIELNITNNEVQFYRSTVSASASDVAHTYIKSGFFDTYGNFFVGPANGTVGYSGLITGNSTNSGYLNFYNTTNTQLGYIGNATNTAIEIGTNSTSRPYKFVGGAAPQSDTAASTGNDLVRFIEWNAALSGNSSKTYSVGTATLGSHAVRLDQIAGLLSSRPGHTYTNTDWTWLDKNQGLIIQWGFLAGPYDPVTDIGPFSFPIAFPSACFTLIAGTNINSGGGGYSQPYVQNLTTSQFSFHLDQWNGTQSYQIYWFAIGV